MPTTKTFNNTSYSIPLEGELNWATLSDFLVALADYGQTINKQKVGIRVATASPVTVLATTDCVIVTDLTIAGAVAVNLPAGVTGQIFTVVDGKGDAGTNNITITPAAGTINGAATYVIDSNRAGVSLAYNGTSWTVIAEFISSGDIPRNQIAAGTANHVVINDGSGDLSSEATLAQTRGGMATDASVLSDGYVKKASGNFTTGAIAAGDLPSNIDATKIANGTVDNTEFQYLNGVTSSIQTQLGAKADGAASSTNNAIARFDLATGKVLKNSSVTVDDTGTVAGVNDITPTTINSVAMANYLTTSNTKAVTNKDIDGGTASNTNRITIPKDTKTNLDALTRKEGTLVYASDLDKLYADDGSTLKEIGSGGSGINYLADYFTADTLGTVGNGNVTDTGNRSSGTFSAWQSTNTTNISLSVSGASPLRAPNCYLFTGSGNNASGTTFVESPAFQLHVADLGKAVMVSFDLADVTADGNFDVCMVRYNSSGTYQEKISIAGFASGATPASAKLPLGVTKFSGFFISSATSTDYYALRIRRLAGTDVPRMDSIKVSPDTVVQGAAVTDWYTPTTAPVLKYGSTTATNTSSISAKLRRQGDSCDFKCKIIFNGVANANGTIRVTIPDNLVVDTTKLAASSYEYTAVADFYTNSKYYHGVATVVGGVGTNYLEFTRSDDSGGTAANWTGNTTAGSNVPSGAAIANNDWMQFIIIGIPISNWSSNVTMADRAVEEFAYNTSTWDTEDIGTSNFGYGAAGTLGGTTILSALRNKRVRFQTPILPTDKLFLEVSTDRVNWVHPGGNWTNAGMVEQLRFDGTNYIGMGLYNSYYSVQTDTIASFGRYLYGTTGAYNGTWYWRVRKVSSGAAVGFPISPANLVKSIARYSTNAGQTLTSGAAAVVIDFEDKTFDTKSEVTTGASWKFTAKESGYYRVKAQLMLDSTAGWAAGEWLDMYIRKNGTNYTNFTKYFEAAVTGYALCTIEDVVQLNSGEYIDIAAAQNNGANISLYSAQSIQNFVNVEQIG